MIYGVRLSKSRIIFLLKAEIRSLKILFSAEEMFQVVILNPRLPICAWQKYRPELY